MPRKPRFYLPGVPVYVVQCGHSRKPVFFDDGDYQAYLYWLGEASDRLCHPRLRAIAYAMRKNRKLKCFMSATDGMHTDETSPENPS
jgi:hypothetical protein